MCDLAIIVVGMDGWEQWTRPAIMSIRKHEPDARLVVMDCGKTSYPQVEGVTMVRLENSPSYAYALNQGVKAAGKADWYLMLNNDVILYEPVHAERLDKSFIYGKRLLSEQGHTWLELWLALIPYWVWYLVGEWDEGFKLCGFEDADYCIRAKELGISTLPVELNIKHFWGKTRWALPDYKRVRMENITYFERKHGYRLGVEPKIIHD